MADDYDKLLGELQDRAESLPPVWSGPILDCIKTRRKWNEIARRFPILRDRYGYEQALSILSEKHQYSKSNIERIVQKKNPYHT